MQKNFVKKTILLFFAILFACKNINSPDPYILSLITDIRQLEKQDHQLCTSLKLNVDKEKNFDSSHYWRCRLTFAKYRISTGQPTPQQVKRDLEISDLVTKISLKIGQTSESFLSRENKKIDNRHHQKCLDMGYAFYTEDQAKIDEYFSCRKALIEDQQLIPPYNNTDYHNYPNDEYNIGFAIDRRLEESIKKYNEEKAKYPLCVRFNLYSENFKRCIKAQDNTRQCFKEIDHKRFKREWIEKTTCQKQSYTHFSDDMIKKTDGEKQAEIARDNSKTDYYNNYNFASIGIDGTLFAAEAEKEAQAEEKKAAEKKERIKKINSKSELYSKFELTKLRQSYATSCQQKSNVAVEKYVEELKKSCDNMAKFEMIGDE